MERPESYTTQDSKSSDLARILQLLKAEAQLTQAMRKVPIGAAEGRRLFALRARVRQQLANGGQDIVFVAHRDQPKARMTEWALDQPAGGAT